MESIAENSVPNAEQKTEPKYREIFEEILNLIKKGVYPVGSRLPSESEIGSKFSASRITVNRAMRELQVMGLIRRRPGSGSYVCSPEVSRQTFGLLIPGLGQTEIFEPICQGIADAQRQGQQHDLLWAKMSNSRQIEPEDLIKTCEVMLEKNISGVFFAPVELVKEGDEFNRRIAQMFDSAKIPVVLLDRDLIPYPGRSNYDLIGIDNRRAGYRITKHLLDQGCKRLAFSARPNSAPTVGARIAGYREALFEASLPIESGLLWLESPENEDKLNKFLRAKKPDGIVCANDFTAAVVMKTLQKIGVSVPHDIALVGIDDVKYAHLLPQPLTTIHQPSFEMGTVALETMLQRIKFPNLPARDVLLNFELVIRESCGAKHQKNRVPGS